MSTSSTTWTKTAKGLHWLIALLLVATWAAVELHEIPAKGDPWHDRWKMIHFSLGLTVLVLMIVRLYWRSRHQAPARQGQPWQRKLSLLTHGLLYLVVLAMPLLGVAMRQFAGRAVEVYGLFVLPQWVTPDKALAKQIAFFHRDVIWYLLLALVILHTVGGLWHHFINRDNTLRRMLPNRH